MKKALGLTALGIFGLLAVLVIRTLRFTSKQVSVQPAAAVAFDQAALATRLAQALRFQTVSHQDSANVDREAFLALHRYLTEQFPLLHARLKREVINDYSLLYTWEGREPQRKPALLLAHLDVVPAEPGTEARWSYPPFDGRIAEGFVWGRGALDDKQCVLGILEAVEKLLQNSFEPQRTVILAFGHDEEVGGENGAQRIVELLHSRGVEAEYVLDEGGAVIQGLVPGIAASVAAIGTAEKGSVSVELTVRAEGGHSSAPPPQTAVGILSAAVHNVESHQMPVGQRGAALRLFEYVGPEMPFGYRLVLANLWLFGGVLEQRLVSAPATNATLRTTTAATMIDGGVKENVLPTSARAVINFRILPGDSAQTVVDHVRQVVNDARVEVQPIRGTREPSAESPVDSAGFALLQRTIGEIFPAAIVTPYLTIGGTDSRYYAPLTQNIYRFTPVLSDTSDLTRIHGINERLSLDNYERAVQFFVQLIRNS